MTLPDSYGLWLLIADWLIRIAALFWIPSRSRPAAARSWLLLVGFVPLLGLPIYLVLGHPWVSAQRRERQAAASRLIVEKQAPLSRLRWDAQARSGDRRRRHRAPGRTPRRLHADDRQRDRAARRLRRLARSIAGRYRRRAARTAPAVLPDVRRCRRRSFRGRCAAPRNAACVAGCCSMRSAPSPACAPSPKRCAPPAWKCSRCSPAAWPGGAVRAWTCATIARSR